METLDPRRCMTCESLDHRECSPNAASAEELPDKGPRYEVYAVDRAGTPWTVKLTSDPWEALRVAANGRSLHPERAYGVWDADDAERGDIEWELADECANV